MDMEWYWALATLIGMVMLFMAMGMPVALTFITTNIIGVILFMIPACLVIGIYSWPYVHNSWKVLEGSKETSGIQGIYLLKSLLIVFAVLMALQGIALAVRSLLTLLGVPRRAARHDDVSAA